MAMDSAEDGDNVVICPVCTGTGIKPDYGTVPPIPQLWRIVVDGQPREYLDCDRHVEMIFSRPVGFVRIWPTKRLVTVSRRYRRLRKVKQR